MFGLTTFASPSAYPRGRWRTSDSTTMAAIRTACKGVAKREAFGSRICIQYFAGKICNLTTTESGGPKSNILNAKASAHSVGPPDCQQLRHHQKRLQAVHAVVTGNLWCFLMMVQGCPSCHLALLQTECFRRSNNSNSDHVMPFARLAEKEQHFARTRENNGRKHAYKCRLRSAVVGFGAWPCQSALIYLLVLVPLEMPVTRTHSSDPTGLLLV